MTGQSAGTVWSETSGSPDDPVIVLAHGSMDRSAGMLRLSRRLSDRFHVIRYDRRGYGRSAGLGPPFTVDRNVDDLERLLDDRTHGRGARLAFGHSFGGNVVLALAARRPDLVERVAVYESPLSWLDWWPGETAGSAALAAVGASAASDADAGETFMRRLVGDDKWERLPPSTRAARRAEGPAMLGELGDLRSGAPWDGALIAQPVLAMAGQGARPHHRQAMRTLPSMLGDVRVVEIGGAGHFGPNTHADAVSAAIVSFLAEAEPFAG
jgi:pimeloyl-ACP methyl ester carboxylesterase